ncbi:MAG: NnrS family protein [Burkholderiales bacterium]|nr:NnrS family protein [Burkholderiales bacterium]
MKIEFASPVPPPAPHFALWDLGFRPFYLLASIFAAISIPLWVCQYAGYLPVAYVRSMVWHGHEMLFGYTLAVITGFLFTAVRNWTGQSTPTGGVLAAFALMWVAGRVLVMTPFEMTAALVNAAFPVAVAIAIATPILRSGNRRNYFFVLLLLLLGAAALSLHLSHMGVFAWPELASLQVGLDLVLFIIAVISGRVMPMFTNNGVPGTNAASKPLVEKLALGSVLLLLAADLLQAPSAAIAVVAALAACAHAGRLALWRPWRVLQAPLVWILHAAYGWIVVYLLLRALAAINLLAEPLAVHALTIGAIGGMTIGMMTRTARGHTGRILKADGFEVACFTLIQLAAVSRLAGGLLLSNYYMATVVVSGVCWSLAFAIYAVRYWPILSMSRVDGKPG